MNAILAERGVKIRRVFLVTKDEIDDKGSLFWRVIEAHLRCQNGIEQGKRMDVRYRIVAEALRDEYVRNDVHRGAWIKAGDAAAVTIVPVYDRESNIIRTIRVRQYGGSPRVLRDEITHIIEQGAPAEGLFTKRAT